MQCIYLDKKNLSIQMIKIQATTQILPIGLGYGIAESYEQISEDKSWYAFLLNRLKLFEGIIKNNPNFYHPLPYPIRMFFRDDSYSSLIR